MAPDGHGLTLLPLLSGERGPGWSDRAGAAIEGLTTATTPLDLLRAGLEAVALRFALLDAELPGRPHRSSPPAAGSSTRRRGRRSSPTRSAARSRTPAVAEGSSRGAAVLALEALGEQPGEAPLGETFEPEPGRHRGLPRRARAPAGALRARDHIDSGASTPSRPSDRAMTALVARTWPSRSERSASEPASRTGQSR